MKVTVVIRMPDGSEDHLVANTLEVTDEGVLKVFNEQVNAKTTTVVSDRYLSGTRTTTETEITRQKYLSGVYPKGCWAAAYSKVTNVQAEVGNEPFN